ncbi:MAG: 16S rRNA (adenine(1518)-N(6)/adenine(1519)-N(6))-dimethyltransferase RsmA [Anaerolineales bacterium]|nr:16S rRNA (adenine(1518)-N(6)/adenine(1519)-N(6))-dimethyltransferase RsmA [Anaerolineales bacterium]
MTIRPLDVTALLRQYDLRPSKKLGQNFLQDEQALQKITEIADIQVQDTILEIGPGLGGLTRHLALAARQVVAVELDESLFPALRTVLAPYANVRLIHADILKLRSADLVTAPNYLVVANIPYYITSALLRHLLAQSPRPRRLVLTVQEEVAERICAGSGKMSLLALSVQVYGRAEVAARIPAAAFFPTPSVNSAVVSINIYPEPLIPYPLLDTFFRLAKAGFGQKRKKIRNSLSAIMPREKAEQILLAAGIDPQRRAETLSLVEWGKISNQLSVTRHQ